jgi:hypothetical protein
MQRSNDLSARGISAARAAEPSVGTIYLDRAVRAVSARSKSEPISPM